MTADQILAAASLGLALVFYPMVVRNQIRGYCHLPLMTSVPKTALLSLTFVGYCMAQLPLAAAMIGLDVLCWLIFVLQRIVLGNKEEKHGH